MVQTCTWLLTQLSLALSQESCSRLCTWAGASAAMVPALVPGTLLSLSTLRTMRSFNVLYLWSLIFIYTGIPLAFALVLRSARYFTDVEGKWTLLPPIWPPSSTRIILKFECLNQDTNKIYCIMALKLILRTDYLPYSTHRGTGQSLQCPSAY